MRYILVVLFLSPLLHAGDRALLVGVEHYLNFPHKNLPGIGKDLEHMHQAALLLGFPADGIKILDGRDATRANLRRLWQSWLVEGVSSTDRILFYFSGHGFYLLDQNGDELDHRDEILCLSDFEDRFGPTRGHLLDDEFGSMIDRVPASTVMIFLDACHTGSATRSIGDQLPKRFSIGKLVGSEDYRVKRAMGEGRFEADSSRSDYVCLAACLDNESALATPKGSLFTSGLLFSLKQGKPSLSYYDLQGEIQAYIRAFAEHPDNAHHPVLSGDRSRFHQSPFAHQTITPVPTNHEDWLALGDLADWQVDIETNGESFKIGEHLEIKIHNLPGPGYLNVINISSDGVSAVLFPNKWHPENFINKERESLVLPSTQYGNFNLVAAEPTGTTLVLAFYTQQEINLYTDPQGTPGALRILNIVEQEAASVRFRGFAPAKADPKSFGFGFGKVALLVR